MAASRDGEGCFLSRDYDRPGRTTLLFGLDADGTNHLSVLNANWSIRPKDRVALTFRLTTARFPDHFAVGMAADGKAGFVTSFGKDFAALVARSRSLEVFRGTVPVERLDLDGSGAAVAELRRCAEGQRARPARKGKGPGADRGDSIPADPFAPASGRVRGK